MPLDRAEQLLDEAARGGHVSWQTLIRAHAALDDYFSDELVADLTNRLASSKKAQVSRW